MFVNTVLWWCINLYYYLFNYYQPHISQDEEINYVQRNGAVGRFEVVYQWTHLNYSWESIDQYNRAIETGQYIPENNAPTGMKFYKNLMFLTVPRFRKGIPATLVALDMNSDMNDPSNFKNPLLTPYPNWGFNDDTTSCSKLQSVQSMEVDTRGVMWVIDGVRINNYTRCPTKLVLLNLNTGGNVDLSYEFPERLAMQNGGFLNDIVVDETDGDFAYITDNSQMDPGIIVYSRRKNQSWKLRDTSMHPDPAALNFPVDNIIFDAAAPVDGIALSPMGPSGEKTLFYCAISSFNVYSLPTQSIKNRRFVKSGRWRREIKLAQRKSAQSDGIIIDEKATMYLTMLPLYGVASWNTNEPFSSVTMVDTNRETMVWPDGFGFDQQGYLYLISNKVFNYIDLRRTPMVTSDTPFRVLRLFTGTRSYLYGQQ